jgi:hypothetical protein
MKTLYEEILAIAQNYMGPAAEEYIRRRIRIASQGQAPEKIGAAKLPRLAAGIDMTAKVYLGETRAARFRDEILALSERR